MGARWRSRSRTLPSSMRRNSAAGWTSGADRPFDLARGPLFRVQVFRRSDRDCVVLLALHHIIGDFWSVGVIVHEVAALYAAAMAGEAPPGASPERRYLDFAREQAEMLAGPKGERLWAYWSEALGGRLPVLDLPIARPRPPIASRRGRPGRSTSTRHSTPRLVALAESRGATLFATLLATFQVLLSRYSGQDDVIVGSPAAGRNRADLAGLVGYFANPLPLRLDLADDPTFAEALDRTGGRSSAGWSTRTSRSP